METANRQTGPLGSGESLTSIIVPISQMRKMKFKDVVLSIFTQWSKDNSHFTYLAVIPYLKAGLCSDQVCRSWDMDLAFTQRVQALHR